MPVELLRFADGRPRVDLDLLYPPFVERLLELLAACRARGCDYYVTSGTRLWDEQRALHLAWLAGRGGRAAAPGQSAHQFGLAVDLTFDADPRRRGLQPGWRREDYAVLVEEAERLGLHSGASYQDFPHVSWPGFVRGRDLAPLRAAWLTSEGMPLQRLRAVWAALVARRRSRSPGVPVGCSRGAE